MKWILPGVLYAKLNAYQGSVNGGKAGQDLFIEENNPAYISQKSFSPQSHLCKSIYLDFYIKLCTYQSNQWLGKIHTAN